MTGFDSNDNKGSENMELRRSKTHNTGRRLLSVFLVLVMIVELGIVALRYPGVLIRGDDKYNTEIGSYPVADVSQSEKDSLNEEKAMMPKEGGEVTLCGVTVSSTAENLPKDQEVCVIDYGTKADALEETHRYDVSIGEHRQFEVPVAVTFPVTLAQDEDITVLHHIEEDDTWMPLAVAYDANAKTVTAYLSSLSEIEVRKEKKDNHRKVFYVAKSTNENGEPSTQNETYEISNYYWTILQNLDQQKLSDEAIRFVANPSLYASEAERYYDDFYRDEGAAFDETSLAFTVFSPIVDITSQVPANLSAYKFDYAEPIGNALGIVTLALASLQTLRDFREAGGDLNAITAPAANAYKNLFSAGGTFYSYLSGYGSIGFSIAFIGVTLVAFQLDSLVNDAKTAMSKRTAEVYETYFSEIAPFDKNDWYNTFRDAYYNSSNNADKAMEKIAGKINRTVETFWTDIYKEDNLDILVAAAETDTKELFTKNNIYFYNVSKQEKNELNAQMKQELWKKFKKETMPLVDRFLIERIQETVYSELSMIAAPYNNYMNYTIMETVFDDEDEENEGEKAEAKFAGCTLALGREDKPVESWDMIDIPEDMTDGWQTEYSCTVMGYLEEGCPDTLLVYESEAAARNGDKPIYSKHFTADLTGKQSTVIDLSAGVEEAVEEGNQELRDNWYIGAWCDSKNGSGNAFIVAPTMNSGTVVEHRIRISSVEDGNRMEKYRCGFVVEIIADSNGEYIILPQSEPDPDGNYYSAIKIYKPKDNSGQLDVVYAPAEVTGNKGGEGKATWYKRDFDVKALAGQ